jgi:hypothetical protein
MHERRSPKVTLSENDIASIIFERWYFFLPWQWFICWFFLNTVNGHKYSSPSNLRYIFHIKSHFFKKEYCEVIFKRILIIFAPEEADIFTDYLFILAHCSVRLLLFSNDLKTIFVFWCQICYAIYFNKNKIGKINTRV